MRNRSPLAYFFPEPERTKMSAGLLVILAEGRRIESRRAGKD